jgi:hypothetical protein
MQEAQCRQYNQAVRFLGAQCRQYTDTHVVAHTPTPTLTNTLSHTHRDMQQADRAVNVAHRRSRYSRQPSHITGAAVTPVMQSATPALGMNQLQASAGMPAGGTTTPVNDTGRCNLPRSNHAKAGRDATRRSCSATDALCVWMCLMVERPGEGGGGSWGHMVWRRSHLALVAVAALVTFHHPTRLGAVEQPIRGVVGLQAATSAPQILPHTTENNITNDNVITFCRTTGCQLLQHYAAVHKYRIASAKALIRWLGRAHERCRKFPERCCSIDLSLFIVQLTFHCPVRRMKGKKQRSP